MFTSEVISTFFVSQAFGDDSFTGVSPTVDKNGNGPYKTVERAIDAIKELRNAGSERPLTISFVDDYFLSKPVDLSNLYRVTLNSYRAQKRVIGGVRIDNWKKDTFNGKECLSAVVPENVAADFTDLYVNGERAKVTRFPKKDTLKIVDADNCLVGDYIPFEHFNGSSKWFRVNTEDLSGLDGIEDAMINYYHYWIDEHSPIESYDAESGILVMKYNSRFAVSATYDKNPNASPQYYLSNIPNCFEEKGHWYLDKNTRKVYYIPQNDGITPENIEALAPLSDKLFIISGEDIRLCNLELTCTRGDYASTAKIEYVYGTPDTETFAADIQSVCNAPGAITFKNATRCGIYDCYIHGVGIYGVEILAGSNHIHIENNRIYDVCAGGIRIAGGSAQELALDEMLAVSDCIIRRNHIYSCDKRYLAGCGIFLMNANNCEISENEIHDLEYSGISAGWVWGYKESATYGCIIKKNHIYDIGKGNLSDLGGIYLLGKSRGTVVSENTIHDIKCFNYGAWGIYLDEGSSYVTVEKNVVYNTDTECFHLHYGSHNTVRDNLLLGGDHSCVKITREEKHDQVLFEQNVFVTDNSSIYGSIQAPEKLQARRNILWSTKTPNPILWIDNNGKEYYFEEWRNQFHNDEDSIVADPRDMGIALDDIKTLR